jgi:hypothetical protein
MRRKWIRVVLLAAAATVAGGGVTGCAEERPPINRVQPNALAKTFFVGNDLRDIGDDPEFYMRGTVVDVGYGAMQDGLFTSTYAQPVSRIRWEVTEGYLNARLAYERIVGTDGKGEKVNGLNATKTNNDGQIVASYRIESHFDIRRDYNSATGEESNVIVENTSDRPWNEREYMRVDWSRNLITTAYDFDTLAQVGLYGGVQYEGLAYYVNDPHDADAPYFDPASGYFDITNKAFATPVMIDLSSLGWGIAEYPACYLDGDFAGGTAPAGNCNPVELKIRNSFKKVVDKDYEPLDYDGYRFRAFGIFNYASQRMGYERNYGLVDARWYRFAARYNMWERSHYYKKPKAMSGAIACATTETTITPTGNPAADPNRDDNNDGTADECAAAGPGSQCDVFNQKCTLPYTERKVVTIPWYIGGTTDEDLFEATEWATLEWDLAMKTSVQISRLVECRKSNGGDCEAKYPMWSGQQDDNEEAADISRELIACYRKEGWNDDGCKSQAKSAAQALSAARGNDPSALAIGEVVTMDPVIVLCHNPVVKGDHEACGAPGLTTRLGDLRYNSVLIQDSPQTPSPWGIMVDGDDPITGEKVASSINIWNHVTDIATQGLVDLVRYMNGELKPSDVTEGKYIRDWAQASKLGSGAMGPTMTAAQVDARLAASTKLDSKAFRAQVKNGMSAEFRKEVQETENFARDTATRSDVASPALAEARARMAKARGTHVETELLNKPMLDLAGIKGSVPLDGAVGDLVSPLAANNPMVRSRMRQAHENALAARGACILHEAPESSALTGIADAMIRKFPKVDGESEEAKNARYKAMQNYLRRRYHYAVIAHEMGHSIGLRHNFVSSYAALHFRPQYWQLRTKNGGVTKACDDSVDDGSTCVGPRYFDPVTDEEQSQLIWMFMHSTVMDYPGDVSQDLMGLGAYDYAAARLFYGDNVAVYTSPSYAVGTPVASGLLASTDTFGGLFGIKYGKRVGQGQNAYVEDFHYSQLQNEYGVIHSCYPVQPTPPASWRPEVDGNWDAVLDGRVVSVDGAATKCRQESVDYVGYTQLRAPTDEELAGAYFRGGPAVDPQGRLRVPYSFATDSWADTGNVSVFRHDNGADPYEQTQFLITTQENRHIFDNYRRGRTTFSARGAADRSFGRYNEKLLGIAGGLGFYANIYQSFGTAQGYTFDTIWPFIVDAYVKDNMIAATVAFDHFARQLSRPHAGEHYRLSTKWNDPTLRASEDSEGNPSTTVVIIPNGSTGYLRDIGFGGHPLNNAFAEDKGEYDTEFTVSAGSYYDKIHAAILLSESEDRFVSSSRQDFYDARFRASGMADVLPEGWRRLLSNALTNDRSVLASFVEADSAGKPKLDKTADTTLDPDAQKYPSRPLGWTTWWPASGPQVCFPTNGKNLCSAYGSTDGGFEPDEIEDVLPIDPQVGWEVQKFLIAWTAAHIPANQHSQQIDSMRIYRLGLNSDPAFENRIEWQDPQSGQLYYAKTFGQECLFGAGADAEDCAASGGKWVEKGIAARVLQYANQLTAGGYKLDIVGYPGDGTVGPGFNKYGRAMVVFQPDGSPVVESDPALQAINPDGTIGGSKPTCDLNVDPSCTPLTKFDNHFAVALDNYKSVPDYLWEVVVTYGLGTPDQLGIYPD